MRIMRLKALASRQLVQELVRTNDYGYSKSGIAGPLVTNYGDQINPVQHS